MRAISIMPLFTAELSRARRGVGRRKARATPRTRASRRPTEHCIIALQSLPCMCAVCVCSEMMPIIDRMRPAPAGAYTSIQRETAHYTGPPITCTPYKRTTMRAPADDVDAWIARPNSHSSAAAAHQTNNLAASSPESPRRKKCRRRRCAPDLSVRIGCSRPMSRPPVCIVRVKRMPVKH